MPTINPAEDLVWSLSLISGQVAQIQRHIFEHMAFAPNQVEVEPFTPSYENWAPKTKDEYFSWVNEQNHAPRHVQEITSENITTGSSVDEMNEKTPVSEPTPLAE